MDWGKVIGLAAIGIIWIESEPGIRFRNCILGKHQGLFRRLLECAMCSTFWISLIYFLLWEESLEIMLAASSAVLAELISQKLKGGKIW